MISIDFLPKLVILLFSVVFHEVAHGWMALKKGDTTARDMGRLTLNPIPHIDPFGTIILPLMLIVIQSPILIGSAKPVPINPFYFKEPKRDMAIVGAAGPASNLLLAVIAAILFRLFVLLIPSGEMIQTMMVYGVIINLVLAFFNLMPVPPLDGSRIAAMFMNESTLEKYYRLERFGILIVIALLYFGVFRILIWPIVIQIASILIGPYGFYLLSAR
ncbi:site-2 protease family protein [candidate division KSB1 bacterium]|nr:site-2 protease family protein [candidate division KSB1 bacterium]